MYEQVDLVLNEAFEEAQVGFAFYAKAFTDIREGTDRGALERRECVRQMWGWLCNLAGLSNIAYELRMRGLYLAMEDVHTDMRDTYQEALREVGDWL